MSLLKLNNSHYININLLNAKSTYYAGGRKELINIPHFYIPEYKKEYVIIMKHTAYVVKLNIGSVSIFLVNSTYILAYIFFGNQMFLKSRGHHVIEFLEIIIHIINPLLINSVTQRLIHIRNLCINLIK